MISENKKYRLSEYSIAVLAFSVMGDGKVENQDSFRVYSDGSQVIVVIADGLGSAAYSKEGSNKIVNVAIDVLSQTNDYEAAASRILERWCKGIEGNLNQYDTTLKFIKITDSNVVYGGVGDGWIALATENGLISLLANNEFSNQTDTILSFDLSEKFILSKIALSSVSSGLISTDGFSEDIDKDNADKMLKEIECELNENENIFIDEMQQTLENWPVKTNKDDKTVVFINVTKEKC